MNVHPTILITCYLPFKGRSKNGSQTLGESLKHHFKVPNFRVLSMPVTWGSVEQNALPLLKDLRPDIVLGLGEGPPENFQIETLAKNKRLGADVDQNEPPEPIIEAGGALELSHRWPLPSTKSESVEACPKKSEDAGAYLCNNALYRFCQSEATFASFFHFPPQGETPDSEYIDRWLPKIVAQLELAMAELHSPQDREKSSD
ncbi:hypothetical protein [Pelagicoccus albus]|uniref:Pyrrolidone-carboxylate peptidase n=1 Tax=Pelagicoccus albus TaxID=415222 RepID=A0A7X1B5Z0_9BACT|nr:hypothetical protein [Pelagicoccus albus]MBC2606251.1 hypothetical protein [Pelagicoccus albus]